MEQNTHVIPAPRTLEPSAGLLSFVGKTEVRSDLASRPVAEILGRTLDELADASVRVTERENPDPRADRVVILSVDESITAAEGYSLRVTDDGVLISSNTERGAFYAVQTIRQLLMLYGGVLPRLSIQDDPEFSWRGVHLDVARHFFDVSFVERVLDMMALYKFNVFHWHLTEDQGWRVQIDGYPQLTKVGAYRDEDGKSYGGYYTKDQIRRVVDYAAERYIQVVPEIEMPGHAQAALAAYPELGCTGEPVDVRNQWGISKEILCAGKEEVFEFLEGVLSEVIELFPSPYVHIGGDEVPKDRWQECERCRQRIEQEGLKDEKALQSYFIKRIETYLNSKGRRLIGWDEILEGGLPPNAMVMSWRGTSGGTQAANKGHDVIMTPQKSTYFNLKQRKGEDEPGVPKENAPIVDLRTVHRFSPVPSQMKEENARQILGGEAALWTEFVEDEKTAEYLYQPRLAAMAEALWSSREERDYREFCKRLHGHAAIFDSLGWNYHRSDDVWG
jgi:hexosaminidase